MYLCTPLSFVSLNPVVQKTVSIIYYSFTFFTSATGIGNLISASVYGNGSKNPIVSLSSLPLPGCLSVTSILISFSGQFLGSVVKVRLPPDVRFFPSVYSHFSQSGLVGEFPFLPSSHFHLHSVISHVCFAGKMYIEVLPSR